LNGRVAGDMHSIMHAARRSLGHRVHRHGVLAKRKSPSSSRKYALDLSTGVLSVAAPIAVAGEAALQALGSAISRPG
jgi:hypothetical protein